MNEELNRYQAARVDAIAAAASARSAVDAHQVVDRDSAHVGDALARNWARLANNLQAITQRIDQLIAQGA
ncbi:MAG: hypothetical protein AB7I35_12215 [Ramlibacter sp.]|nr:hypothetical protein [Ramlibacter sp.]